MSHLPILGWDYTTSPCATPYNPVFYFVPDQEWVFYKNINGSLHVPVLIHGSGLYDDHYWIRIDKQPATELWVGFLPIEFIGFPQHPGYVALAIPPATPLANHGLASCLLSDCC